MSELIRWGILGTGRIAKQFARGLPALEGAVLAAVGSRSQEGADAFGDGFGVARRHGSYEALASDPEVDVVYVATPNQMHWDHAALCLRAGKAVLCEKPFTINAAQAEALIALARERGVFLMEAMWSRFLPVMAQVRDWIAQDAIGEARLVVADIGFRAPINPESRLFNLAYGGGSLMDVGVYAVSFASMVFGKAPSRVAGLAHLGETGVDEQAAWVLGYEGGGLASLSSAIRADTSHEALIVGSKGRIRLHAPFWKCKKTTLMQDRKPEQVVELPYEGNGYGCEAAEVMRCLRAGVLESSSMPLEESLQIMNTLDELRAQWGLKYPME